MSTVVYPGSFDPVTLGHLDIIKRAARIFDKVVVCILNNSSKKSPLFSYDERVNMLREVVRDLDNVYVDQCQGLLVDYVSDHDIDAIIRGIRGFMDTGDEIQMAQGNRVALPEAETVFMATDPKYSFISSSMVREFASYGRSVEGFVPDIVLSHIDEKLKVKE